MKSLLGIIGWGEQTVEHSGAFKKIDNCSPIFKNPGR